MSEYNTQELLVEEHVIVTRYSNDKIKIRGTYYWYDRLNLSDWELESLVRLSALNQNRLTIASSAGTKGNCTGWFDVRGEVLHHKTL